MLSSRCVCTCALNLIHSLLCKAGTLVTQEETVSNRVTALKGLAFYQVKADSQLLSTWKMIQLEICVPKKI